MASKKRVRDGADVADVAERLVGIRNAAALMCKKKCPICLDMCSDPKQKYAVEIKCGCVDNIWHAKCFRQYANGIINEKDPHAVDHTIACARARHNTISVHAADPLKWHRAIDLEEVAELVMSDKKNGGELFEVRKKARAEARNTAVAESERKAREAGEAILSVRGMKKFLAAFYGTLLPVVLRKFQVHMYSLWWYPAFPGDSVGMGYYGDNDIEPWRSPDGVRHIVHTVPSTQVQMRVKFNEGYTANWEDFRAALRFNLGCRCSMAWKYKAATFHVSDKGVPGHTEFNYHACERQIYGVDTWVLTLELGDAINRCKISGASGLLDVQEQIAQIRQGTVPSGQYN